MPDVGMGTTIAFATSSFTATITNVDGGDITRNVIDKTHLGTTGSREKMPGDLVDEGDVTFQFQFDPDVQPPISGVVESITITFPIPSGKSTGATLIGTGFISSWSWGGVDAEDSSLMMGTGVITWDGVTGPTWTDSAV
jgi:hypothetical protein